MSSSKLSKGLTSSQYRRRAIPSLPVRVLRAAHEIIYTLMPSVYAPSYRRTRASRNLVRRLAKLFPINGVIGVRYNVPRSLLEALDDDDDLGVFESRRQPGRGVVARIGSHSYEERSKPTGRKVWRTLPGVHQDEHNESENDDDDDDDEGRVYRACVAYSDSDDSDGGEYDSEEDDENDDDAEYDSYDEDDEAEPSVAATPAKTGAGSKKISALEMELAKLRDQIAVIVSTQQEQQQIQQQMQQGPPPPPAAFAPSPCGGDADADANAMAGGPPPPPPPPPSMESLMPKESNVWETIRANVAKGTGRAKLEDAKKQSGMPNMKDILKGMGSVKLRSVERSPGGTPIRRKPAAAENPSAADIIANALKRKFAQQRMARGSRENSRANTPSRSSASKSFIDEPSDENASAPLNA